MSIREAKVNALVSSLLFLHVLAGALVYAIITGHDAQSIAPVFHDISVMIDFNMGALVAQIGANIYKGKADVNPAVDS